MTVCTGPGLMAFTVTPSRTTSSASDFVNPSRPCLLATYAAACSAGTRPLIEATLMTRRQRRLAQQVRHRQVQPQRQVPEVVVELRQWLRAGTAADAGVVDQNIDRPQAGGGVAEDQLRHARRGQVGAERQRLAAALADEA